MKYLKLISSGIILFSSCNQSPNPEQRIAATNISIPKEYKLLSFKSDWGVGETTEGYKLSISQGDYKKIAKEIERKKFFKHFSTRKTPLHLYNENYNLEELAETACWYNGKYFYQIYQPNPGVIITIELEKDSLMHIDYNDL